MLVISEKIDLFNHVYSPWIIVNHNRPHEYLSNDLIHSELRAIHRSTTPVLQYHDESLRGSTFRSNNTTNHSSRPNYEQDPHIPPIITAMVCAVPQYDVDPGTSNWELESANTLKNAIQEEVLQETLRVVNIMQNTNVPE